MEERNTIKLSTNLVLDIETEGLDPKTDHILEIGAISVFEDLSVSAEFSATAVGRPVDQLSDFIRGMHTKNELLAEINDHVRHGNARTEAELDEDFAFWMERQGYKKGSVIVTGNSVHFDQGFIKARMPKSAAFFHYRVKDIGQLARDLREQCNDLGVSVQRLGLLDAPEMPHRGLADAYIELDEWRQVRFCQRRLLKTYAAALRLGLNSNG